ncbi:MAG: nitroreductase family deazaflavin-dependent oxidoreductase [Anaerolineales bacterium]|nr:nitroreductase family deazaflavin-dependent oxidoreductase [Anaerolineales bacterium]
MSFNTIVIWLLKSPFHGLMSGNTVLIGYDGRKTGKHYIVPVNYVRTAGEDGDRLLITSERGRTWWRNLRGGSLVDVQLQGMHLTATARSQEEIQEVEDGLMIYFTHAPGSTRYFNVGIDDGGGPKMEDIARAAQERVIIYVDIAQT